MSGDELAEERAAVLTAACTHWLHYTDTHVGDSSDQCMQPSLDALIAHARALGRRDALRELAEIADCDSDPAMVLIARDWWDKLVDAGRRPE